MMIKINEEKHNMELNYKVMQPSPEVTKLQYSTDVATQMSFSSKAHIV